MGRHHLMALEIYVTVLAYASTCWLIGQFVKK